jgi:hypothetical protein
MEGTRGVIPERERPRHIAGGGAPQIGEAPSFQRAHGGALRLAGEDRPTPEHGVPHITVVGRDVEVPADHERVRRIEARRHPRTEGVEPRELRLVRGRADRLAVHHVDTDHPEVSRLRRNDPRLLGDRIAVEPMADVLDTHPRQDRDPVVRPLAEHRALVAGTDELHRREELILDLDLLETHHVRLVTADQREQAREPLLDRVDVPGHEAHDPPA